MARLTLRNVVKKYGARQVIHGLDLDVADGEFLVLVGPSGCGKSTLLRMISGLEDITGGELLVDGAVANKMQPKQRNIAMVFQDFALYPHMTVRKNMAFALRMGGMSRKDRDAAVERAAEMLDLTNELERHPSELSGGQKQRVAMGRALVRDPAAFLFDEPLSNLDAKLRAQMRAEIKALHRRLGTTMIYVTHDQMEAMTMGERIVLMRQGVIEQAGTPLQLYDRPENVFVAGFIGAPGMNLIEGTVSGFGGALVLTTASGMNWPLPDHEGLSEGAEIVIGVRPESVVLSDEGTEATVAFTETTGSEIHATMTAGEDQLLLLSKERLPLERHAAVRVSFDPNHIHLFDKQTGKRIN
ncbi:ABC transporter ATP-binding protein [Martelella mediterranea]|uniref:Carbohydrate ABC transporter ATP-binding protein (CUT1 family) n=1 Tax=Martelella mediterranea TaxID=293089 RepID=A0A4R3NTU9_9HYPH|nr:sn-glycerol-3-phosphate ABC transporter ATP-binding protein UgpC [Martelella mediterranea]TCT38851.1 carbohydrate ABC transporter ATP-binding protein (CUT1 family) [Martelella mediterranea]